VLYLQLILECWLADAPVRDGAIWVAAAEGHRGYQGNDAIAVARTTSTRRATDPQLDLDHDAPPFAERPVFASRSA
jgi:hypothetical protein